jgi:integrase
MSAINPRNERVKHKYERHLAEGDGLQPITVEHTMRAIEEFEQFTGLKDFRLFNSQRAEDFRKHLLAADPAPSLRTVHSKVTRLARFFRWLSEEPGFRQRIRALDAKYFELSKRQKLIMQETPVKRGPSIEDLQKVIRRMPTSTPREWRDKALVALIALTGVRIGAVISLKLRHVRPDFLGIDQIGAEVGTKQGRSFVSVFMPLGDDICGILKDYVRLLRDHLGFTDDDPLFPASNRLAGLGHGSLSDVTRLHWESDGSARRIFRSAFEAAGVPYFTPHTSRHSLTNLGLRIAPDIPTFVALSQNLGHKSPLTTLKSYASITPEEQVALIQNLHSGSQDNELKFLIGRLSKLLATH